MKNLPFEYWKQDYETIPTFYQRYWVQRCLELLNADTSYLFALGSINSAMIVEELVTTSPNNPANKQTSLDGGNARTFHHLLNELAFHLKTDMTLRSFAENAASKSSETIQSIIDQGTQFSSQLFSLAGVPFRNSNASQMTKRKFAEWLQSHGMAQGEQGALKELQVQIAQDKREPWLVAHHQYLQQLLDPANSFENDIHHEELLETVTQSWLLELIVFHHYGPVYLNELFVKFFLTKSSKEFANRLEGFLKILNQPTRHFTVCMRLQARKEFGQLEGLGPIRFDHNGHNGLELLDGFSRTHSADLKIDKRARRFFYEGATARHIFATVDVYAKNMGAAARSAIRQLEAAIKQARFEFERTDFSHDNNIFVFDKTGRSVHKFTRRQALADQYTAKGNPVRFERFANQLDRLKHLAHTQSHEALILQISGLALQWHRNAVETQQPEIRFMNNWIELEQVFKTAKAEGLFKGSPGDAVCHAVAAALDSSSLPRQQKDYWGDLQRCNFLGPKPFRSTIQGLTRYSSRFQQRLEEGMETSGRHIRKRNARVDIDIIGDSSDYKVEKSYRIPDGFVMLAKANQRVYEGDYIAGIELTGAVRPENLIESFRDKLPNLVQAAYLFIHLQSLYQNPLPDRLGIEDPRARLAIRSLTNEDIHTMERFIRWHRRINRQYQIDIPINALWSNFPNEFSWLKEAYPKAFQQLLAIIDKLNEIPEAKRLLLRDLFRFAETLLVHSDVSLGIKYELLRGRAPNFALFDDYLRETNNYSELLQHLPDQPLLKIRTRQIHMATRGHIMLTSGSIQKKYIWTLDRMRRTRNSIVHNGTIPKNIELLSRELYYFSKTFIQLVISGIDDLRGNDLRTILHLTTPSDD